MIHLLQIRNLLFGWIEHILSNQATFVQMVVEHLRIVLIGESVAIVVGISIGLLTTRHHYLTQVSMSLGNVAQTLPPLGVIALTFSYIGIGQRPVILALFLYALFPLIQNTVSGINSVDEAQLEVGRAMGMTRFQRLYRIEIPVGLPLIFAGIRTSTVLGVSIAYLGTFIGGGGLGQWVVLGHQTFETQILLAGAIPGALLVILLDRLFARVETYITPEGVQLSDTQDTFTA
jgi:osmoprotectant transport system permease protein